MIDDQYYQYSASTGKLHPKAEIEPVK